MLGAIYEAGDFQYIGSFGLYDSIDKENVKDPIKLLRFGTIDDQDAKEGSKFVKIRMVTGDHKMTAKRMAIDSGIMKEGEDMETNEEGEQVEKKYVVMEGNDFEEEVKENGLEVLDDGTINVSDKGKLKDFM